MDGRLTENEIGMIAAAVNKKLNIPLINERCEGQMLFKALKKIDNFLWEVLPNEIYDLYKSTTDGLDDGEAEMLKSRLAKIINKYVDLPFLSEETEKELFEFVIYLLCDAMKHASNLIKVTAVI